MTNASARWRAENGARLPIVTRQPRTLKPLRSREEVHRFVDLVAARSHAALRRDLLWIYGRYAQFPGEATVLVTPEPRLATG
jgi:hypothetical protein